MAITKRDITLAKAIARVRRRYGSDAVVVGDGKTKEPARSIIAEAVEGLETHSERIEAAQYALVEHGATWNDLGWLKKQRARRGENKKGE